MEKEFVFICMLEREVAVLGFVVPWFDVVCTDMYKYIHLFIGVYVTKLLSYS